MARRDLHQNARTPLRYAQFSVVFCEQVGGADDLGPENRGLAPGDWWISGGERRVRAGPY